MALDVKKVASKKLPRAFSPVMFMIAATMPVPAI